MPVTYLELSWSSDGLQAVHRRPPVGQRGHHNVRDSGGDVTQTERLDLVQILNFPLLTCCP